MAVKEGERLETAFGEALQVPAGMIACIAFLPADRVSEVVSDVPGQG